MSLDSRRERFRSHPIPLTWEVPLLVVVVTLLLVAGTPFVVQAAICAVIAGDLTWPTADPTGALRGLTRGEFGVGLPAAASAALPGDPVMWAFTAVAEVAVLMTLLVLGVRFRDLLGIGSSRGLATPTQAARALGLGALKKNAAVIRPDLYSRAR